MKSTFYNIRSGAMALLLSLFVLPLSAQWQAYTPALTDTVGTYDLRIAAGNDQVAWAVAMKYDVTPNSYNWVATDSLFFTKTTDGGATWTGGTIPMGPEPYASNICPVSATTAWASGVDLDYVSYIMHTNDGGATWTRQLENGYSGATSYINFVHFWDAQNGVAMGDPAESDTNPTPFFEIYQTNDGGATWTRVDAENIPTALPNEYGFGGNYCTFGDHVWFSTFNFNTGQWMRAFHSTDRGATWTASNAAVGGLSFADPLHGVGRDFGSPNSKLRYTDDGGASWTDLPGLAGGAISSLALIPQSHYLLIMLRTSNTAGPFRTMISTDLGQSWMEIGDGSELACNAIFSSPTNGYAGEWQPADHAMRMYKYAGSPLSGLFSGQPLDVQVQISPNPATDVFRVQIQNEEPAAFTLLLNDAQGRLVARQELGKMTRATAQFDVKGLPAGVYSLTISCAAGYVSQKVMKN